MNTIQTIKNYIDAQKNRWATTTLKTEASRLQANIELIELGTENFDVVFERAKSKLAPYSLKTTLIRIADYWAFHGEHGPKRWLKDNANVFRHSYVRKPATHSMGEARALLTKISDQNLRNLGEEILLSGLRVSEALNRGGDHVVGKGGATRRVFNRPLLSADQRAECSYPAFYRALRSVGLKPHSLRKIFATEIARSGELGEADLLAVMGWTNMQTATAYLRPFRDDKLEQLIRGITNEDKRE